LSDNVTIKTQAGNKKVATDEIGDVHHQRVKQGFGADGDYQDVHAGAPMPVADGAAATALGTTGVAEATGNGSIIAVLKRLRTLLGGGLPAALTSTGNLKAAVLALPNDRFPEGVLLYDDNFDEGYAGWQDHMSGSTAQGALSLASFPSVTGGKSLKLSTGPRRNASSIPSSNCTAIKRMSLLGDAKVIDFEVWWSYGAFDLSKQIAHIEFSLDYQRWDSSSRGFPTLRFSRFDNTSNLRVNEWRIKKDDGTYVAIPDLASRSDLGENEDKQNMWYTRLRFDLSANGGTGGYVEAQVNDLIVDLSGLGAGRGLNAPQTGGASNSFAGGMNFLVSMANRNNVDGDTGKGWVAIDRARGSIR
jgi:hypothetical protein